MKTDSSQPGILAAAPVLGRSLTFRIVSEADLHAALKKLHDDFAVDQGVLGVGEPVACALIQGGESSDSGLVRC